MSMNTYPLNEPLCLNIDETVTAYLLRPDIRQTLQDKTELTDTERTVLAILSDDARFLAAMKPGTPDHVALNEYDMFNVSDAEEILLDNDIEGLVYMSEFQGKADLIDDNGNVLESVHSIDYEDDYIVLITPERAQSYFHTAYFSINDFIAELKLKLDDLLPEDFDYRPHIMSVNGTYFC